MIIIIKQWFEKKQIKSNDMTEYFQTDLVTCWYFLGIPIYTTKTIHCHAL